MTESIKRQVIKALAYGKNKDEIKDCTGVTDEDINSITMVEINAEKQYYKKMGYIR